MSKSERFKRLAENRDTENSNPQKPEVIEKIVGELDASIKPNLLTTVHEHAEASVISNSKPEELQVPVNNSSKQEQLNATVTHNTNTEQLNVTEDANITSRTRIPKPIEEFEKRLKKPTVEETHTRGTWLIRNDLLKRLEKLARHQQRGFKTHLVNYALERVLDELENR